VCSVNVGRNGTFCSVTVEFQLVQRYGSGDVGVQLYDGFAAPVAVSYSPSMCGSSHVWLSGSLPLSEFNTEYDRELDDTEYTTLGGYLFGQLGRLPRSGDRMSVGDDVFEIVEMEGRRVKTVRYLRGAGATTT